MEPRRPSEILNSSQARKSEEGLAADRGEPRFPLVGIVAGMGLGGLISRLFQWNATWGAGTLALTLLLLVVIAFRGRAVRLPSRASRHRRTVMRRTIDRKPGTPHSEDQTRQIQRRVATPPVAPPPLTSNAELPPTSLLDVNPPRQPEYDRVELVRLGELLCELAAHLGIEGELVAIYPGPVLTTYELQPAPGIDTRRIVNLEDDLATALEVESVRIERFPGRSTFGIQVANKQRSDIAVGSLLESQEFRSSASVLTLALGVDIFGRSIIADLATMPHLLIAGATGADKRIGLQSLITSILYKATPDQVKFILIDPKRIELGGYAGIPHLKTDVVAEPQKAANALVWAESEMERRYRLLAELHVRSIGGYHRAISKLEERKRTVTGEGENEGERKPEGVEPMPYVVIVIGELAELMNVSFPGVETSLARLGQMARAVGIHLIVATEHPSVDVLTPTIRANFPCRLSYATATRHDSRTILDLIGAERLLGHGDALFLASGSSRAGRLHSAHVSGQATVDLVRWLERHGHPTLDLEVLEPPESSPDDFEEVDRAREEDEEIPFYRRALASRHAEDPGGYGPNWSNVDDYDIPTVLRKPKDEPTRGSTRTVRGDTNTTGRGTEPPRPPSHGDPESLSLEIDPDVLAEPRSRGLPVHVTMVAPETVQAGVRFVAEVVFHIESYQVKPSEGQRVDADVAVVSLCSGAQLGVRLVPLDEEFFDIDQAEGHCTWGPPFRSVGFSIRARREAADGTYQFRVELWCEGVQLARVYWDVVVAAEAPRQRSTRPVLSRRLPSAAFASYSHDDRIRVAERVESLIAVGIDVFLDCLDIQQAENWQEVLEREILGRDALLLFWSSAARQSKWVDREWHYALEHRGDHHIIPNALE